LLLGHETDSAAPPVVVTLYYDRNGEDSLRTHIKTLRDDFLWGYLKWRFYQNKQRTIDALKANINEEIQTVTADVLASTFQNMAQRVQSCLDANGGHFQRML